MNPAIRQAIARIDVLQADKSASRGTGTLVTSDLVLTAMHVVADRSSPTLALYPGTITLAFPGHVSEAHVVDRGWNPNADWILLRCVTPPPYAPMPLADTVADGAGWETYGFPDANPRDGMVQIGTIDNASGIFEGVHAFQLFSNQAAAGAGAPVKGLSGGPVVVDGALVGVLRSSLMRDGVNVAGTLYSCPVDLILEATGDLLPVPDPCRGLAGLPRQPLPVTPFRFLDPFTSADAEIFFGRNREIRQVRDTIIAEGGPSVVLLYGQSGAGKSSFLDAGLLPRLTATHAAAYLRRQPEKGLLATLLDGLRAQLAARGAAPTTDGAEALRLAWLEVEASAARPLVVVVDQVEEVFTLPGHDANELAAFVEAIAAVFHAATPPRGRLILGFRKEWFAEIQKQLEQHGVEFARVFLETLDAPAIVEVVTGLQTTKRLRSRYGLDLEAGLAENIARDLTADNDSPVAPTLQVLLSKMWRDAVAANAHAPRFSDELYARLNKDGVLLTDFFDQQLAALEQSAAAAGGSRADVVTSGLAVDVLAYHTTAFGSAEQRTADELNAEYRHRPDDAAWIVQELKRLYLLTDPAGDAEQTRTAARLSHDTLAHVVRARSAVSGRPGQRGRRIVENRAAEWSQDRTGVPLDSRDLELVEQGLPGMRRLLPDEERLVQASRAERQLQQQGVHKRRLAAMAAGSLIAVMLVVAGWLWLQEQHQRQWSNLFKIDAIVPALMEVEPIDALVASIGALDLNLDLNDEILLPGTRGNLVRALGGARERASWQLDGSAKSIAVSSDNRIAVGTGDGIVRIFRFDGADDGAPIRAAGASTTVMSVAFSTDGEFLAAALDRQGLGIWTRRGEPLTSDRTPNLPPGIATAVEFAPDSHVVIAAFSNGDAHSLYVCDVDNGTASAVPIASTSAVSSMATARGADGQLLIATAGNDVAVWTQAGKLYWKPVDVPKGAITTADITMVRDPEARVLVAAGSTDGSTRVWDTSGQQETIVLPLLPSPISAVSFGYQGRLVHATSADGGINTYDVQRNAEATDPLITDGGPEAVAVSADGERIVTLALGLAVTHIQIFDLVGPQLLFPLTPPRSEGDEKTRINALAFAGLDSLMVGRLGRMIPHWQLTVTPFEPWAKHQVTMIDSGQDETRATASNVTGDVVVLAGTKSVNFLVGGKRIDGSAALTSPARSAALSPDGETAVVGCDNGAITLWNPRSGRLIATSPAHSGTAWAIAFDAAGAFATGGGDAIIRLWAADGSARSQIKRPEGIETLALAYHHDGALFVGDSSGRIEQLDRAGKVTMSAQVFRNLPINALVIPRNGDIVFIAGREGVRVLDVATGVVLGLRFPRVPQNITSLAIRADGALLAGANDDNEVWLWRADWSGWLAEACDRLSGHAVFRALANPTKAVDALHTQVEHWQRAFSACSSRKPAANARP